MDYRMQTHFKIKNDAVAAIVRGIVIGLLLSAVFVAGFLVRDIPAVNVFLARAQGVTPTASTQYPLLGEVQGLLNENYLRDQPDQKQLEYAAIRGLLGSLNDKYTFF